MVPFRQKYFFYLHTQSTVCSISPRFFPSVFTKFTLHHSHIICSYSTPRSNWLVLLSKDLFSLALLYLPLFWHLVWKGRVKIIEIMHKVNWDNSKGSKQQSDCLRTFNDPPIFNITSSLSSSPSPLHLHSHSHNHAWNRNFNAWNSSTHVLRNQKGYLRKNNWHVFPSLAAWLSLEFIDKFINFWYSHKSAYCYGFRCIIWCRHFCTLFIIYTYITY